MSYAIIRSGGKQFRVEEGATVRVPLMNKQAGEAVELDVLMLGTSGGGDAAAAAPQTGAPLVEGARVAATVVDHGRDDKIIVFKKKRRKQYKRKQGHRQGYTMLKIDSIG
ncbi:MAG TPA: 50S ribosomal protein L21 [Pyrinomonadaceae bacterium]|jgi:large subunit ribosomal protein L21|nr:50S ribosomal protein L21 [Pyrinomonadaceae bacterium]